MKSNTKKITTIAMFCAISFILALPMFQIRFNGFLDLEVKNTAITIAAFLMGPVTGLIVSAIVPIIEMLTVSPTGPIGALMNILASASFACTAAFIYKKRHDMKGAVLGLTAGALMMTIVMLLWNYIITPFYMYVPRSVVAGMLLPVFLPFNLLKGGINMALTLLLYKPIAKALRKTGLVPESAGATAKSGKINIGFMIFAIILLATCVLLLLVYKKVI